MHLLIDFQGVQNDSRFRGIGRYSKALVEQLVCSKQPDDRITLLFNGAFESELAALREAYSDQASRIDVHVWYPLLPCDWAHSQNKARRLASEHLREFVISRLKPDVVLVSSLFEGCADNVVTSVGKHDRPLTAVVFYDLIPLLFPASYLTSDVLRGWYADKLGHLKRADLLLAISESSRCEAIGHLSVESDRIVNISSGIDPALFGGDGVPWDALARRLGIAVPYFLYVGAGDPRKNLRGLIDAFGSLDKALQQRCCLVFVGQLSVGQKKELIQLAGRIGLPKRQLIFAGHVSDDEVIALYKHALAFVFPSLHEGFGLPLLEAIAAGTPVIASNRSTSPEVLGNSEALFDPDNPESMCALMARLLSDGAFGDVLREQQLPRLALFRWNDVGDRAWMALRQLAAGECSSRDDHLRATGERVDPRLLENIAGCLADAGASTADFIEAANAIDRNLAPFGACH